MYQVSWTENELTLSDPGQFFTSFRSGSTTSFSLWLNLTPNAIVRWRAKYAEGKIAFKPSQSSS